MVRIRLSSGSESERALRGRLRLVLRKHGGHGAWEFTDDILIDEGRISHSHPVLTIGTKSSGVRTDGGLLSVYLHEQIHWFLSRHPARLGRAISDLKARYPNIKVGTKEGGARDEKSTYLHLLVCLLEYDALVHLIGGRAKHLVKSKPYYEWIYQTVLSDYCTIKEVAVRNGLVPHQRHSPSSPERRGAFHRAAATTASTRLS